MAQLITCIASVTSWDEDRADRSVPRVTPAKVSFKISPEPDNNDSNAHGTKSTDFHMTYLPNQNASFIYTEVFHFDDFGGKQGSFIAQGKGTFNAATFVVKADFEIVEGTGTAELEGIKGSGSFGPAAPGSHDVKYEIRIGGIPL